MKIINWKFPIWLRFLLLAFFLLISCVMVRVMDVNLVFGDLKVLKGEKLLKLEYVYDENMKVGRMTETDYIKKKVAEYNQKQPGSGDRWARNWRELEEAYAKCGKEVALLIFSKGLS